MVRRSTSSGRLSVRQSGTPLLLSGLLAIRASASANAASASALALAASSAAFLAASASSAALFASAAALLDGGRGLPRAEAPGEAGAGAGAGSGVGGCGCCSCCLRRAMSSSCCFSASLRTRRWYLSSTTAKERPSDSLIKRMTC